MSYALLLEVLKGGPTSGNWGHAGRPGKKGGSAPKSGMGAAMSLRTGRDWQVRQAAKRNDGMKVPEGDTYDREQELLKQYGQGLPEPTAWEGLTEAPGWDNSTRSTVKDEIATALSQSTGLSYDAVNKAIHQWAETSNDTDYRSLSMQESAARVFGTQLSEWQKNKIENAKDPTKVAYASHAFENDYAPYNSPQQATDKFLKAMYDHTQNYFKEKGISKVILRRGTTGVLQNTQAGDKVKLNSNALESWTAHKTITSVFGHDVLKAEIPVSRIVGTARTGFGCLNEYEFVVIGGKDNDYALVE